MDILCQVSSILFGLEIRYNPQPSPWPGLCVIEVYPVRSLECSLARVSLDSEPALSESGETHLLCRGWFPEGTRKACLSIAIITFHIRSVY